MGLPLVIPPTTFLSIVSRWFPFCGFLVTPQTTAQISAPATFPPKNITCIVHVETGPALHALWHSHSDQDLCVYCRKWQVSITCQLYTTYIIGLAMASGDCLLPTLSIRIHSHPQIFSQPA